MCGSETTQHNGKTESSPKRYGDTLQQLASTYAQSQRFRHISRVSHLEMR
jgi:hypothetical protein